MRYLEVIERVVDQDGNVHLDKELRQRARIAIGSIVQLYAEDGWLTIKPKEGKCFLCESTHGLKLVGRLEQKEYLCERCLSVPSLILGIE